MTRCRVRAGAARTAAVGLLGCALVAGCSTASSDTGRALDPPGSPADPGSPFSSAAPSAESTPAPSASPSPSAGTVDGFAVDEPAPFRSPLASPDVLVSGTGPLPRDIARRLRAVEGVEEVLPLSVASASVEGRTLSVAAVDAGRFRRFTEYAVATSDEVWARVAGGEVALDRAVDRRLLSAGDMITLGTADESPEVHVGAVMPLVRRIDVVVNAARGRQLGLPRHNALLVDTGAFTPSVLRDRFEEIVGDRGTVQTLALEFEIDARESAVLTGTSVSRAVGTFTYTNRSNGEISPDPAWVRTYIRTEPVPLLGEVTCNKAFLPQLRAALEEVVASGLSGAIHPDEFAGCYYPRYIGRDPANGLSLHSWGIAVDLNTAGNQRGTVGEIDRRVVAIFKKWGMAWGGDWSWTDPMHFEMNAVVRPG